MQSRNYLRAQVQGSKVPGSKVKVKKIPPDGGWAKGIITRFLSGKLEKKT